MRVTVVTVCRQAAGVIGDCIRSVALQDYPDVEHLVIDGASTDGTVPILRSAVSPRLSWVSEPDEGLYFALNQGLARARGDVVGFLHADDVFAGPDVLSAVARALEDPLHEACYGDLQYVCASDPARVVRHWRSEVFTPGMFGSGWMPPHPTFYARLSVYQKYGGFDTRFPIGADWDLLLRFLEIKKIRTAYLPQVMVRMRLGGVSNRTWMNILRNNLQCVAAFRKYGRRMPVGYPWAKLRHRLAQFR